ncbi:MAG: 30S ribosomal protein S19e [Candidatus Aenigmarchaeota archaeon ex4484_56]|nr:MAG: 30S ribosomal protein S19e [Candidatus Aenigmarchaeota archaeon ex4484_56]
MNKIGKDLLKLAEKLKDEKIVEIPEWANFVKTSVARERVPQQDDWWYIRAASILRKIYLHGPIGTNRLSKFYGGRKNRGYKPEKYRKGARKLIRVILQQLESKNLIKKVDKPRKGRQITEEGRKYLNF